LSYTFNPFTASLDAVSKENINDGLSQGQMSFWDATLKKWVNTETSELFWDDVNKRLGILEIRAKDINGLKLYDKYGKGIFIKDGGNVGIGMDSPDTTVHIVSNTNKGVIIGAATDYYHSWMGTNGLEVKGAFFANSYLVKEAGNITWGNSNVFIEGSTQPDANYFRIATNELRRLSIIHNGNVGIGTRTPTALLHLKAGTTTIAPLKLTEGTLLTTPEKGTVEFANNKFYITNDGHQRAIDRTSDVMLESVTVENTTVETLLWTVTMDADSVFVGNVFRFSGIGKASNVSTSDVVTIRVKVGGVTKVTITNSARNFSNDDLHIKGYATQRTIGVSGTRAIHIDLEIGQDTATVDAVGTIDTTKNMDVTVTAQWSNAKTGNTITLEQAYMQYKN